MITTKLKGYRKANGFSQSMLAELAQMPQTTLSGWEVGLPDNHPIVKAIRLAQIFETSVEDLFTTTLQEPFAAAPRAKIAEGRHPG